MWNGVFLPMQKSVGTVRFVPLIEMTNEDWAILEFEYLRSVAKNRIAQMIEAGELVGFFHVNVETKAVKTGKHNYFWPATAQMAERFARDKGHEFFKHERDDQFDEEPATRLDYLVALAQILPNEVLDRLITQVVEMFPDDADAQRLETKAAVLDKSHRVFLVVILLSRHLTFEQIEELLERVA